MRIQHNIPAMTAYRNYTNNVSSVQKNLERLSSGYKINRAGDDAAGLAISEKMRAQITGLEVAQKNAKDGISLVQTAEGALTEVHDMLNRMFELSEQSANGTYQDEVDRENLQKELEKLRTEINRIADSSNFNGINLLDGSMESKLITEGETELITKSNIIADGQMGKEAQAGQFSIDFSNTTVSSTATDDTTTATLSFTIFGKTLTVSDSITSSTSLKGEQLASSVATAWNGQSDDDKKFSGATLTAEVQGDKVIFKMDKAPTQEWKTAATTGKWSGSGLAFNQGEQVTVTTDKEPVDSTQQRMYAQASVKLSNKNIQDGSVIKIGDTSYVFAVGAKSNFKDAKDVISTSGAKVIDLTDIEQDGLKNKMGIVGQRLSKAAEDNKNFKVGTTTVGTADTVITFTEREGGVDYTKNNLAGSDGLGGSTTKTKNSTPDDWKGLITMGTANSGQLSAGLTLQIGDTADDFNQMKVSVSDCHADAMGIGEIDISTQAGAAEAMKKVKDAINYVSDVRGTLGATQNRLDHTINNLSVMQENIQDAESTIRDVDVAKEMMEYTKNNILVQSAQAMLAQANQLPQGVLQLLG